MKNALLLLSIWVGIILAAYVMVYWDPGIDQLLPTSVLEPASSTYLDPNGRFSLAVPWTWSVEETDTSVLLADPSEAIEVAVFAVEGSIPEAALLAALGIIGSGEEPTGLAVEEVPAAGASERAVRIEGPAAEGETSYGLAYLYEGETIILLVRGADGAIEDSAAELGRIEAGISIPAGTVEGAAQTEEVEPVVEL